MNGTRISVKHERGNATQSQTNGVRAINASARAAQTWIRYQT
jgi:hypothetical protein